MIKIFKGCKYLLLFLIIICFLFGGCECISSGRKGKVIVSSTNPAVSELKWTYHTNNDCPNYSYWEYEKTDPTFYFRETGGETWVQITNYSIKAVLEDGTDVTECHGGGGVNIYVPVNSEANVTLPLVNNCLANATFTSASWQSLYITITFTGYDGVGNSISVVADHTVISTYVGEVQDVTCPS